MEPPVQPGPPTVFESLRGAELPSLQCSDWFVSVGPSSRLDVPRASHKAPLVSQIVARRRRRRRLTGLAASRFPLVRSCSGTPNRAPDFRLRRGVSKRLENGRGRRSVALVTESAPCPPGCSRGEGGGGGAPRVTARRRPLMNLTFPAFPSRPGCDWCSWCPSCWWLVAAGGRSAEWAGGGSAASGAGPWGDGSLSGARAGAAATTPRWPSAGVGVRGEAGAALAPGARRGRGAGSRGAGAADGRDAGEMLCCEGSGNLPTPRPTSPAPQGPSRLHAGLKRSSVGALRCPQPARGRRVGPTAAARGAEARMDRGCCAEGVEPWVLAALPVRWPGFAGLGVPSSRVSQSSVSSAVLACDSSYRRRDVCLNRWASLGHRCEPLLGFPC